MCRHDGYMVMNSPAASAELNRERRRVAVPISLICIEAQLRLHLNLLRRVDILRIHTPTVRGSFLCIPTTAYLEFKTEICDFLRGRFGLTAAQSIRCGYT